jgi:hypothetical protein
MEFGVDLRGGGATASPPSEMLEPQEHANRRGNHENRVQNRHTSILLSKLAGWSFNEACRQRSASVAKLL